MAFTGEDSMPTTEDRPAMHGNPSRPFIAPPPVHMGQSLLSDLVARFRGAAARFLEPSRGTSSLDEGHAIEVEMVIEDLRRSISRAPRVRGRLLAQQVAEAAASEPRVTEVWYADRDGDPLLTVLTASFDDEVEDRLHQAMQAIAERLDCPTLGHLAIYAADEPYPAPPGVQLFASPEATAPTPAG